MGLYSVRVSVCGFPVLQLQDQARTGSWMWVNCDLAISLPGGDKSSPCWCVNHSVITSSCHDCLRMRASGNLHCRSLTDTRGGKHSASLSYSSASALRVLVSRWADAEKLNLVQNAAFLFIFLLPVIPAWNLSGCASRILHWKSNSRMSDVRFNLMRNMFMKTSKFLACNLKPFTRCHHSLSCFEAPGFVHSGPTRGCWIRPK